ncbi:MAG: hypothetical protein KDJ17_02570 [Hyphomicrobiaceae bacterium]|nr:hypothetical protein [Hyphomicrobiaceae bacterium]
MVDSLVELRRLAKVGEAKTNAAVRLCFAFLMCALSAGMLLALHTRTLAQDASPPAHQQEPASPPTSEQRKPAQPDAAIKEQAANALPAAPQEPADVTIGVYVNDIQDIDFKTNSYVVDLYLWLRWRSKDLDPIKSVEFMNIFDPESQQKTVLLDAPKEMPDGTLYNIIRYQGRFAKKFRFEKYPFDRQTLEFIVEDSVSGAAEQRFVADTRALTINPKLTLPGFRIGKPRLEIEPYKYPTDFGDLSMPEAESYSRVILSVPITRPMFTLAIKTFVPILLIVLCAMLVFFVNPHFVEGRIGLAITALLTLVAIQFTAAASLPDADYFTMLDKIYMLSYAFIIASLLRVVVTSWQGAEKGTAEDVAVSRGDHRWGFVLLIVYSIAAALIAGWVLMK